LSQFKIKSQPQKILELENLIISMKDRLGDREATVHELSGKLKEAVNKSTYIFDERQAISSLSTAMKEKDMIIFNLKNELKSVIHENENKKNEQFSINKTEPSKFFNYFRSL
jgi:predicted RNase H-like nuclease (RuvC/YqgF family)